MEKYNKLIRTTLGEYLSNGDHQESGIYILACYPALGCIYVGRSNDIYLRMRWHLSRDEPFGNFVRNNMADACRWRFDLLVAPTDDVEWAISAESALIKRLSPMLNEYLLS